MRRLALSLFALSGVLLASALYADGESTCTTCGTNYDYGNCDPLTLSEHIISNCQNACSSNCVRLTPAQCQELKDEMGAYLDNVTNSAASYVDTLVRVREAFNDIRTACESAQTEISAAISTLQNGNDAVAFIRSVINNLINLSNRWHTVEGGVQDGLFVSNVITHTTTIIETRYKIGRRVNLIVTRLESAIDSIERREENEIPTAITGLQQAQNYLNDFLQDSSYGDLEMEVANVAGFLESIRDDGDAIGGLVSSMNCQSCGKGSSSPDGSGGGGASQDFTPIVSAINELKERLEYWMNRFWDIMHKYYEDYNSADQPYEGKPTYGGYVNLDDNWFKRVEYLLYAVGYGALEDESTEPVPVKPDKYDELSQKTDSIKSGAEQSGGQVSDILNASVGQFKNALQNLAGKLVNFEPQGDGVLAGDILVVKEGVALSIDQDMMSESTGVGKTFAVIRQGFRVLWTFLTCALYVYGLFFFIRFVLRCVALMYKAVFDSLG